MFSFSNFAFYRSISSRSGFCRFRFKSLCFASLRLSSSVQSSADIFLSDDVISLPVPSAISSKEESQSCLEASERCYTVFLRTDFFSSSGIWTIFSQSRMRSNCFLCSIGEVTKHAAKTRSFMRRNFDGKR